VQQGGPGPTIRTVRAYPDAIAALVLPATRYPVARRQPWEPRRTRLRAGITQGGMGDEATAHHMVLAVLGALLPVVLGATAAAAQAPVKEVIQVK
jgi:hypothetical protein